VYWVSLQILQFYFSKIRIQIKLYKRNKLEIEEEKKAGRPDQPNARACGPSGQGQQQRGRQHDHVASLFLSSSFLFFPADS
jgi:hypothetical protein